MLIPIGHEHMTARRWPIITFVLIASNVIVFLLTLSTIQSESPELAKAKEHILRLAAMHPELEVPEAAQDMVEKYKQAHPDEWAMQSREGRPIADEWDLRIRGYGGIESLTTSELQSEMNVLVDEYIRLRESSLLEKYAFVPSHPTPASYLAANFMHGSWLHLIGNMWFLWLAGVVLEDVWGRVVFPIFYVIGGIVALLAHSLMNPGSLTPVLGASGAVAALMGAFMVRFPGLKIHMVWWFFLRVFRFDAPAIALLPLWVASEIFFGFIWGGYSGVAHWAHVGGFVFGALGAVVLRFTGIERKMDQAIVEKINSALPETFEAQQLIEQGEFNAAEIELKDILERNPTSTDALKLLQQVYWRRTDIPQYQETTLALCQACLKARDTAAAWEAYEEFLNSGGQSINPACWLDVTRLAEETQRFDRAVDECEKLIGTYPNTREALMAQIRAGRICQKQLVLPQKATAFYEAAYASPVPHLDLEQVIATGIRECKAAATMAGASRG